MYFSGTVLFPGSLLVQLGFLGAELSLDFLSVWFCWGECMWEWIWVFVGEVLNGFLFGFVFWEFIVLFVFWFFPPLPALPLFYLQHFTLPGESAEAVLGIAWGLSFANYFWQRAMSVRSIFSYSVLSHHASPREENENLIIWDFITTFFFGFEICFEEPMHIYHWKHNTLNKYSFQCYIPVLCVLTLQLERGWC